MAALLLLLLLLFLFLFLFLFLAVRFELVHDQIWREQVEERVGIHRSDRDRDDDDDDDDDDEDGSSKLWRRGNPKTAPLSEREGLGSVF
jgi:hypothetical protein